MGAGPSTNPRVSLGQVGMFAYLFTSEEVEALALFTASLAEQVVGTFNALCCRSWQGSI